MSTFYKTFKLLLISSVSLFIYHFINNNNYFKLHLIRLDKSFIQRGFEFFILTNITKYFFLLLGIVALILLVLESLKFKNKCT